MGKTYSWDKDNLGSIVAALVQTSSRCNLNGRDTVLVEGAVYDSLTSLLFKDLKVEQPGKRGEDKANE